MEIWISFFNNINCNFFLQTHIRSAILFQNQWSVCKKDLVHLVVGSFKYRSFPIKLNETYIALVPKIPSPRDMTHLRFISLYNTTYKIISKVIVHWLSSLMPDLIIPSQVAFVPGGQIQDNIIVAQEVLHKLKIIKGKKGYFSWKIDIVKAYDRLQWSFIRNVIVEVGLKGSLVDSIMLCVSTVHYKTVLNGELTDSFTPMCGITQREPLSPYLFVLCMEKLSHLVNQKVNVGLWKQASVSQPEIMKECLDLFCNLSWQQVSFSKSHIFCSRNINEILAKSVSTVCGSLLIKNLELLAFMRMEGIVVQISAFGDGLKVEIFQLSLSMKGNQRVWCNRLCKDLLEANLNEISRNVKSFSVAWVPLGEGFVKLNVDRGCIGDVGTISTGGMVRDHLRSWLGGFILNKRIGTVIETELWWLFEGLYMVWRRGFCKVIVKTDSMSIVHFIEKDTNHNHPMFSLIQCWKRLIVAYWNCSVKHVYREGDMVADGLAKLRCYMEFGVLFSEEPPPAILDIVDNDARDLILFRFFLFLG
ncbi:hypothetical protein Dsin_001415 [Dipteronia sinensis]|uniref:Reverse transcriptase domain-containing protein n=1 Tax=Dipteronia sinensis TaxID=43782 RepID=A0AAE0B5K3_9ROSI|nr:hypothetical protein Dsin_001415 [Dipteronia sinensis]